MIYYYNTKIMHELTSWQMAEWTKGNRIKASKIKKVADRMMLRYEEWFKKEYKVRS